MLLYCVVLLLIGYVLRYVSCFIVLGFRSISVLVMYCCMCVIARMCYCRVRYMCVVVLV